MCHERRGRLLPSRQPAPLALDYTYNRCSSITFYGSPIIAAAATDAAVDWGTISVLWWCCSDERYKYYMLVAFTYWCVLLLSMIFVYIHTYMGVCVRRIQMNVWRVFTDRRQPCSCCLCTFFCVAHAVCMRMYVCLLLLEAPFLSLPPLLCSYYFISMLLCHRSTPHVFLAVPSGDTVLVLVVVLMMSA